jgi:hypothetical protein
MKKLKDRSKPMIFVGYEARSMAYRAYDPSTKCMHVTCDVVFEEEVSWCWGDNVVDSEFIIEYVSSDHPEVVIARHHEEVPRLGPSMPIATPSVGSPAAGTPDAAAAPSGVASAPGGQVLLGHAVVHATPPIGGEANIDAN